MEAKYVGEPFSLLILIGRAMHHEGVAELVEFSKVRYSLLGDAVEIVLNVS